MRVLLASSPERGHVNPLLAVAQHLVRAGHHVGWLTLPEPLEPLAAHGIEVLRLPGHVPAPSHVTGGAELARLVRDEATLRRWIRNLLLGAAAAQVEPVRQVLRDFRPDRLALDGMQYGAVLAAHLEGQRWVGLSSALTLLEPTEIDTALMRNVRALADDRRALFAAHGLAAEFRTCEVLSPELNLVFATEELVGREARLPPATRLVGPALPPGPRGDEPPFPWEHLATDRPIVYVSYGSQISWQPEAFAAVAEAAAPLGAQVVISAGDLARTGFARSLTGDVLLVEYVPQIQLLPRAAVFVSHGGANSVMEALALGVPLVLLPVCNDQFVQAHFLRRSGCGQVFEQGLPPVDTLRAALRRALDPRDELRQRLDAVTASYRAHDGARAAAELILA